MLTVKNVVARQARDYYERGYHGGGRWYGRGALYLGLPERIANRAVYHNLLDGYSPDRSRPLTGRRLDPTKHRAAIDCTFNAPKSVSLLALAGGDTRLINAHRRAVRRTLDRLEEHHSIARAVGGDGIRRIVNTDNLTIARFDHIETRDLDPHLHTHCVVMNFTRLPDGRWRVLHNGDIYRHRKEIGMVYQRELAVEVMKSGYEVVARNHGQFEIAGFAEKDLESFSKRRMAILALVGESATAPEREAARIATRVGKRHIEPGELKLKWREEAAGLGIEFPVPGRPTVIKEAPEPIIVTPSETPSETDLEAIAPELKTPELETITSLETDSETSASEPETSVVTPSEIIGEFPIDGCATIAPGDLSLTPIRPRRRFVPDSDVPPVESFPLASDPVISPIGVIPESFPLVVSVEDGEEKRNPRWEVVGSESGGDEPERDELLGETIERVGFFEDLEEEIDEEDDLEQEDDLEL